MSTIERFSRTIPASGVIEHGRGNVCLLISSTASINLRADNGGHAEGFNSFTGGVRIERVKPWDNLRILGTAGTTVEYLLGQMQVEKDLVDVFTQIATISGIVPTTESPAATVANTPAVAAADAAQTALFAANLLRKRITIFSSWNNAGAVQFRTAGGGVNNIGEVQPGMFVEFKGTYGLDVRNDTGAVANLYIFEEA